MSDLLGHPPPFRTQSPDWVMLGVPEDDGTVTIYASRDLREAQFIALIKARRTSAYLDGSGTAVGHHDGYEMKARLAPNLVEANGPTYGDALRYLLTLWSPDQGGEPVALPERPPTKEIGP